MNGLRKAYSLMMMAAMFNELGGTTNNSGGNNLTPEKINVKPKPKLIPKGCKVFSVEHEGQYYDVIALNYKNAQKKLLNTLKK